MSIYQEVMKCEVAIIGDVTAIGERDQSPHESGPTQKADIPPVYYKSCLFGNYLP